MHSSRFQLGLMATLAMGLGFSLASSDAVGYPAGAAVSLGSNPVVSTGGQLTGSASTTAMTAVDSNIVITSVVLSAFDTWSGCGGNSSVILRTETGVLGRFVVGLPKTNNGFTRYDPVVMAHFPSGLLVKSGETLTIESIQNDYSSCQDNRMEIEYTVSGYSAQ